MKINWNRLAIRGIIAGINFFTDDLPKWYRLKEREAQRERRFQRIMENSNKRKEKLVLKIELEDAKRKTWIVKHNQRKQHG